jgi:hypothetical protein
MNALHTATLVLRRPSALFTDDPGELAERTPSLLVVLALGAGTFGAVVGSQRSVLQALYAGTKVPMLVVGTLIVALPAVAALYRAAGSPLSRPRVASGLLVAGARLGVVAGAIAPWLWLALSLGIPYHLAVLTVVGALGLATLPALGVVRQILGEGPRFPLATFGSAVALLCAGAQTGWLLRPFVSRPTQEVAFIRPIESNALEAASVTGLSAVGVYGGWSPRREGLAGKVLPTAVVAPRPEVVEEPGVWTDPLVDPAAPVGDAAAVREPGLYVESTQPTTVDEEGR